ncbi:hypothetical protein ACFLW8_03910 [Chloroflexota bacterium]
MGRPTTVTEEMEDFIRQELLKKPRPTANEIYDSLIKYLEEINVESPGESAFIKRVTKLRKEINEIPPSKLDAPWSLGSCLEEDISAEVVIPIQHFLSTYGRHLTIRRARWYSMLHPLLLPVLEKSNPGQPKQNLLRLFQISSYYTRLEQIAITKGEPYPDTRYLDDIFLFRQDFSFVTNLRVWEAIYMRTPPERAKELPSPGKIEHLLSESITEHEAGLLNKFIDLLCIQDNLSEAIRLAEENPEIQPLVEEWLPLGLRRDISKKKKKVKK